MTDEEELLRALRLATVKELAARSHALLDDVIAACRETGDTGVVVAAIHLQDSFAAFAAACRRTVEKTDG